jgi:hypothetical protein
MTDHSSTIPVLKQLKGYGKYGLHSIGGCEVGKLLKRYANLIELLSRSDDSVLFTINSEEFVAIRPYDFDLIQAADDHGIGVVAIERLGSITGLF